MGDPALDGGIVHQDFVRSRGFERYRFAIAVKTQDADAILMEFPAVDPAVLSEYGIDKEVLFRIAEAPAQD